MLQPSSFSRLCCDALFIYFKAKINRRRKRENEEEYFDRVHLNAGSGSGNVKILRNFKKLQKLKI